MPARRRNSSAEAPHRSDGVVAAGIPLQARNTLPQQVQAIVPSCAQSCLNEYLDQQYSGCDGNDGLSCLCTQYSSQGYTLGELAFICLQKDCPSSSDKAQQNVYGICSAQSSEVPATHSTLTLSAAPTTISGVTTTTVEVYASSSASTASPEAPQRSTLQTTTSSRASETAASPATAASPTSSAASESPAIAVTAPVAASDNSTTLTSGQAVGVSVAAFGGIAVLVALIWVFACWRRRKGKGICKSPPSRHSSYDFVDDAPPRFSPFNYGHADPRGPLGGFVGQRAELPGDKRMKSQWYREQFPAEPSSEKVDGLGLALSRNISPESCRTHSSNGTLRTVSQLLPEKPGETPPQPPQKRFPAAPSMKSPETVFEEYNPSRSNSKRVSASQLPAVPTHAALLRTKGAMPGTQCASQPKSPPSESKQPSLSLTMPRKASRAAMKVPSPILIAPPPLLKSERSSPADRTGKGSRAKSGGSSKSGNSLLDYYTSPAVDLAMNPLGSPFTPISLEPQRRVKPIPAAITVTRPAYPPRAVRRASSAGSDTSFESTDPDEPTPPDEEDKQLSPVAEHSPIAAIRYPKVPRSSNQSIPRSPPMRLTPAKSPRRHKQQQQQQRMVVPKDDRSTLPSNGAQVSADYVTPERPATSSPSLTGSTLAAKRTGNGGAAAGAEKRLYIDTSHSRSNPHIRGESKPQITPPRFSAGGTRQESPLKGYGRVTSAGSGAGARGGRLNSKPAAAAHGQHTPDTKGSQSWTLQHGGFAGDLSQVVLKSPLWEPKLTPRRRGDDLFLEVGLASPGVLSPGFSTPGVRTPRTPWLSTEPKR
ncbi:hypothetical protein LTR53_012434 [Teratosphaeriaceae sp. CCFEE 6253]|nr:hypothetical protein LTR53_012434 [Teratosphaeriaceae sp. CCFEE 6253]